MLSRWSALVILLTATAFAAPPDKSGVKPNVISLPSGAGSIEGLGESFEPQLNTGTSSYGVGIALPPGRAGLQPKVRLSYNSGQGNGLAGLGWSLDFPCIKRQTDKGFPGYVQTDTFVFQGEELVPLNNATRDWRCENDSGFQRFRQIDTNSDLVPDAWEMRDRDGTRHIFGQYRGQGGRWSSVTHPTLFQAGQPNTYQDSTYCWMVDTTIDLHGNRIEYEYTLGTNILYPSRITYSHSGAQAHEVVFLYQSRADIFDDYRPTFSAQTDRRLRRIEARSSGSLVRAYDLQYSYQGGDLTTAEANAQSAAVPTGVSLLKRVVQSGRDGNPANTLPPLVFVYSTLQLGQMEVRSISSFGGGDPGLEIADQLGHTQFADINGDGLPDLFSTLPESGIPVQRVALNRGEDTGSGSGVLLFDAPQIVANPTALNLASPDTTLTDTDGDGLVDFAAIVQEGIFRRLDVYANRARLDVLDDSAARLGFNDASATQTYLPGAPSWVAFENVQTKQLDLNFDKVSDFLTITPSFPFAHIEGYYRDAEGVWRLTDFTDDNQLPNSVAFVDNTFQGNTAVQLADMNGDRLLDIVLLELSGGGVGATLTVSYWPMCSLGKWGTKRTLVNSDGDDLQVDAINLRDVYVEDLTGDGLADLLIMDGSGSASTFKLRVNVAGGSWSLPQSPSVGLPRYAPRDTNNPTIFRLLDLNGNGSKDLFFRNSGFGAAWQYVELMPGGKPNLLSRIDNGLGKSTAITYGTSTEDMLRAKNAGQPWTTKTPFPVDVVRRIRTTCGLDLNGDGQTDQMVSDLIYRDAFYDGFEREFRGFAFAQRVDYGDDFLYVPVTGLMVRSSGWNVGNSPTGQVSGPSLVTRYRFHTGASDRKDNDSYPQQFPPVRLVDEVTGKGGREEEILKGRQLVEEKVDAKVLHGAGGAGFDQNARAAALAPANDWAAQTTLTPDVYVYTRARQEWTVRRLYRPAESLIMQDDADADGNLSPPFLSPSVPAGRFATTVRNGSGRSVSFAFVGKVEAQNFEANGTLSTSLGYPTRGGYLTRKTFDYDDYGNETFEADSGIVGGGFDDERTTTTSYALGGNALSLWVIGKPDVISVTDEAAAFVSKKVHFYDGASYTGLQGQIQDRALLSRTQEFKTAGSSIDATRTAYDGFGNPTGMLDPVGNQRTIGYDSVFHIYPVSETIVVGGGSPDLTVFASYDTGFGVVTSSTDFNSNSTSYQYDTFARLVGIVRPGDSVGSPTLAFEYQPADPSRGRIFTYDALGNLSIGSGTRVASRVVSRLREKAGAGQFITAAFTDGCGKKLATVEESASTGTWVVKNAMSYNLRGGPQTQWQPFEVGSSGIPQFGDFWDFGGRPIVTADLATDKFHDSLGRELATLNPPETVGGARKVTMVQHLPFEERHFDEDDTDAGSAHVGTPMVHYLDGLGRMIAVEEVVKITDTGDPGGLATWRTSYTYDLNDQLTRIQDSQNNVKTMVFDGLKRMTSMNDPDRGAMTFIYDDASNLKDTIDAKGQHIAYTYDGANRIKTEDYQDVAGLTPDVTYTYDVATAIPLGNGSSGTGTNTKGQLASVQDLSGATHFSYDARARVISEVKRIPDRLTAQLVSYPTAFAYDSADRIETLTYPDGDQLSHGYNPRNLLTQLSGNAAGNIIGSIAYRPSGQLDTISYGNGVGTAYTYDPRLRLRSINTQHSTLNTQLVRFNYTFDGASNITAIDDQRALAAQPQAAARFNTQSFTYDSLYRLTRVDYPGYQAAAPKFVQYRYDRIGNMLQQTSDIVQEENGLPVANLGTMTSGGAAGRSGRNGRTAGDPPGPHALTGVAATRTYDYDANGNMLTIDGLQCTWDFKDRLTAVENAQMKATYTYDYTDRRITKTVIPKSPLSTLNPQLSTTTSYINKYFEVRDYDAPVKYVWNGDTRVARVTASLTSGLRTQALRLRAGWNLVALRVGGFFPALDPAQNVALGASAWWNPAGAGNGLVKIDAAVNVPAGVSAWIYAQQDTTVFLTGTPAAGTLPALIGGSQFLGNALAEPLDLTSLLPANAFLMRFDATAQTWRSRYPGPLASVSTAATTLPPGESLWTRDGTPGALTVPAATLSIRYYHQDHLGSSSVVTDQAGALVEETANYAFGHPRTSYKPGPVLPEPYGFTQKERDKESGLHYLEARQLTSSLNRFLTIDAKLASHLLAFSPSDTREMLQKKRQVLATFLSNPQKINGYAYGLNNPLRYIDPTGYEEAESVKQHAESGITSFEKDSPDAKGKAYTTSGDRTADEQVEIILDPKRKDNYTNIKESFEKKFDLKELPAYKDLSRDQKEWFVGEVNKQAGKSPGFPHVGGKAQDISVKNLNDTQKAALLKKLESDTYGVLKEKVTGTDSEYGVSTSDANVFHVYTK